MTNIFTGKYGIRRNFAEFLSQYKFRNLLFIAGCGFESRTTRVLQMLAKSYDEEVECMIINLLNKNDPNFESAQPLQRDNMVRAKRITGRKKWPFRKIASDLYTERFVAHRSILRVLEQTPPKQDGDVLVDISCLPRSIVFPVLRILSERRHVRNLFVVFTDDKSVGHLEHQAETYRPPYYIPLFEPKERRKVFRVWLPILGSDYVPIKSIQDNYSFNDTFPVIGFPSSNPIESDEIVRRNRTLIEGRTDKVIFASMNDPFQLSMKLNMLIDEISESLGPYVRMIITPHGSKPQSVGAFMTAIAKGACLLYCQPGS